MGKIVLKSVRKSFGDVHVIPGVDRTIEDGEFVVFVGPSGCGKSTLLRLIAGLEDTTSGAIEIDGSDATALPPAKRGLAMVFQSYALYPHMTVRKNIQFPLKMARMDEAEQARRVERAAKVLNLTSYLDRRPGQLSGGQRQRVAIDRAIVWEPAAFLLDEPLSNLDAALRVGMRQEISELHQSLKTTMIYVTHDQVEAMTMADKIVVLNAGWIEQVGSPLDLYNHPQNTFVAGFIGSPKMNLITGAEAELLGAATIGVRPEHLDIVADGGWQGVVGLSEHLGSGTFLKVTTEAAPIVEITRASYDRLFAVNVAGTLFCLQAAARHMIARGKGGKIINMASQAGRRDDALVGVYRATKAATISLTQSAGLDLIKHRINVNAIAPGVVDGAHWDGVDAEFARLENRPLGEKKRLVGAPVPYGRMGTAQDMTGMAIFLATAEADYIVAQTFGVDSRNWMA